MSARAENVADETPDEVFDAAIASEPDDTSLDTSTDSDALAAGTVAPHAQEAAAPEPAPIAPAPIAPSAPVPKRPTTDVGLLPSLGLGMLLYGLMLLAVRAGPDSVRTLLLERGAIPHVILVLSALALAILLIKALRLAGQKSALRYDLAPPGSGPIGPEAAHRMREKLSEVQGARTSFATPPSFYLDRMERLLDQFSLRPDPQEASRLQQTQSETDAASVMSSFTLVKVLVWAIPILGFIGTVIGIAGAVTGFSASLEAADQIDTIKGSLGDVTMGLAVAFDTTLIALVASIFVMLPASAMQRAEERLLGDVDELCTTRLIRRLQGPQTQPELAPSQAQTPVLSPEEVAAALTCAVGQPLAEVLDAHRQLLNRLSQQHATTMASQAAIERQLVGFAEAAQRVGPAIERSLDQLEQTNRTAAACTQGSLEVQQQLARELGASRKLLELLAAGMGGSELLLACNNGHSSNGRSSNGQRENGIKRNGKGLLQEHD